MYLSRIHVQWPKSKSAYTLHKALWELFPNRPDDERDFLFRVEQEKIGVGAVLLLQSQHEPAKAAESIDVAATRDFSLNITEGLRVRFLLKANPVKTINDEKGRTNSKGEVKKCRVPLIKESEQLQWLQRRFGGVAQLEEVEVSPCLPLYFKKHQQAGKIVPVKYQGVLTVNDATAFTLLIQNGLGPAKALGCGMVSIAPA